MSSHITADYLAAQRRELEKQLAQAELEVQVAQDKRAKLAGALAYCDTLLGTFSKPPAAPAVSDAPPAASKP
jgi:xanthine/CO dehydrogenase XdhC/CoxF family maturation factor